jgi:membrane protein DedA with SNARE-associated domain
MSSLIGGSQQYIMGFISSNGYAALVFLMILESASLPIPSEIVIPTAGYLSAQGVFNPFIAFIAILIGSLIGIAIDYGIGYYAGKDVVYKHLKLFRVKKESIDAFDSWFTRNGAFAVFVSRLIPEVRGLMSIPAGFARMPLKKFYAYSTLGIVIWNTVLMAFGYYLDKYAAKNAELLLVSIAGFAIVLYVIYWYASKRMKSPGKKT